MRGKNFWEQNSACFAFWTRLEKFKKQPETQIGTRRPATTGKFLYLKNW